MSLSSISPLSLLWTLFLKDEVQLMSPVAVALDRISLVTHNSDSQSPFFQLLM
jgi:hypothetical protein